MADVAPNDVQREAKSIFLQTLATTGSHCHKAYVAVHCHAAGKPAFVVNTTVLYLINTVFRTGFFIRGGLSLAWLLDGLTGRFSLHAGAVPRCLNSRTGKGGETTRFHREGTEL